MAEALTTPLLAAGCPGRGGIAARVGLSAARLPQAAPPHDFSVGIAYGSVCVGSSMRTLFVDAASGEAARVTSPFNQESPAAERAPQRGGSHAHAHTNARQAQGPVEHLHCGSPHVAHSARRVSHRRAGYVNPTGRMTISTAGRGPAGPASIDRQLPDDRATVVMFSALAFS